MNERQVMEYMEQAGRYGISPGLGSIRELCRRLGDPQKQLKLFMWREQTARALCRLIWRRR